MTHTTIMAPPAQFSAGSLERQLLGVAVVTFVADWLFIGHQLGISAAVFALAVCAACIVTNDLSSRRAALAAGVIIVAGVTPLIESTGFLSIGIAIAATFLFAMVVTGQHGTSLEDFARRTAQMVFLAPFRLLPDMLLLHKLMRRGRRSLRRVGVAAAWLVPALFGLAFAVLFAAANPLIENWVLNLGISADDLNFYRIVFWIIVSSVVWPALRVRYRRPRRRYEPPFPAPGVAVQQSERPAAAPKRSRTAVQLFNPSSVLRSLILFNALFAVQTVMDLTFLWAGADLPDGVTYAEYAHRGAYTLIAAALLSAVFVLIAMRPDGASGQMPVIRTLVYVWVAQNVLLVASAVQRLNIYVDIYALTHWRVAAFIWMGLVAAGLVLIVARIALQKSNTWLVAANTLCAAAVLYACTFLNFTHIIATYNVAHSREVSGKGVWLDTGYLRRLGVMAIPAMDTFLTHQRRKDPVSAPSLAWYRTILMRQHFAKVHSGWRAWSYRDQRLARYLERAQIDTLNAKPASRQGND